jgi:dipeptidyl aminopeptidase/acylaminoacyl peptidase
MNVATDTVKQEQEQRRFGSWSSPITIDHVIRGGLKIGGMVVNDTSISWTEGRPAEAGRTTLMEFTGSVIAELTPAPFNVRSRVHEYGGGAWVIGSDFVIFSNLTDNLLYRIDSGEITPITADPDWRYADLQYDRDHDRLFAIREDHNVGDAEPVNTLVMLDPRGPNPDGGKIIVSGTDFVSSPTLNQTGDRIAWLSWNHPNMPWDGCDLFVATIDPGGHLTHIRQVAGGPGESIVQPRFLPDSRLGFISDRTGWWNLYIAGRSGEIVPLAPMSADFGFPAWQFGESIWDIVDDGTLVTAWHSEGIASIGTLDLARGDLRPLIQPFTSIRSVRSILGENAVVAVVGSATEPTQIARFDLATGTWRKLRGEDIPLDHAEFSIPETILWPTPDGAVAHGFYYPPANPRYVGKSGELPPIIVETHGGPTGATTSSFSWGKQFWTSRGFAILDVNYGGSTGYGRAYRERLNGKWGIVDVQDCISGVEALIARGLVDRERVIIRGGSAGGYTTLRALTTSHVFRIGTSYYGIGDLETLATDTHKFESRYLDSMVGPYPERRDLYVERSPIHHTNRLTAAMLLLQGLDDKVVPPNQSEAMAAAVRAKHLPVALIEFEGEGHGFRGEAAQRRSLEAELSFYSQMLGFKLADEDEIEPVTIENL